MRHRLKIISRLFLKRHPRYAHSLDTHSWQRPDKNCLTFYSPDNRVKHSFKFYHGVLSELAVGNYHSFHAHLACEETVRVPRDRNSRRMRETFRRGWTRREVGENRNERKQASRRRRVIRSWYSPNYSRCKTSNKSLVALTNVRLAITTRGRVREESGLIYMR